MWEKFEQWHKANPHVWLLFVRYAWEAIRAGREKYSARNIIHRIRWHTNIEMRAVDEFKINNNWSPYYARVFMMVYNRHGFFELRTAEGNEDTESRLVRMMRKQVQDIYGA